MSLVVTNGIAFLFGLWQFPSVCFLSDKPLKTRISKFRALEYLTNRFHVAVRLFSNRSQMTSKCGKNKKVAHEAIAECVTDVLTTF